MSRLFHKSMERSCSPMFLILVATPFCRDMQQLDDLALSTNVWNTPNLQECHGDVKFYKSCDFGE